MGTGVVETTRGSNLKALAPKQQAFVLEMMADPSFNASRAAKRAGYANPPQAANRLLKDSRIKAMLGKETHERNERVRLGSDEVLAYIRDVLFFNPMEHFFPNEDGTWTVKDLQALPENVARLIDTIKVKVIELPNGATKSEFEVRLVSKATALALAAKHVGVEKHEFKVGIDWDTLVDQDKIAIRTIEDKIAEGLD